MKVDIKDGVLILIFAALVSVFAFLNIPIASTYLNLQIMIALLAGAILGPWVGAIAMFVYVALGMLGAPIFPGAGGGPTYILEPDFGYVLSFIPAAWVAGKVWDIKPSPEVTRWMLAAFALVLVVFSAVIASQFVFELAKGTGVPIGNSFVTQHAFYGPVIFLFLFFVFAIWVMYLRGAVALQELSDVQSVIEPIWGGIAMLAGLAVIYLVGVLYLQFIYNFIDLKGISFLRLVWVGALKTFPIDMLQVIAAALIARWVVPKIREENW